MKDSIKPNLGQWRNSRLYFSDHEKKIIIEDYLSGNETKQSVYYRYTGYPGENGKITMWMRKFNIEDKFKRNICSINMPKENKKIDNNPSEFESLQLQKRVDELEKQLKAAEMKAIAFSTMVDIAEKEFNISIRKKYSTKS